MDIRAPWTDLAGWLLEEGSRGCLLLPYIRILLPCRLFIAFYRRYVFFQSRRVSLFGARAVAAAFKRLAGPQAPTPWNSGGGW